VACRIAPPIENLMKRRLLVLRCTLAPFRRAVLLAGLCFASVTAVLSSPTTASAERWLCPQCLDQTVERDASAKELSCAHCGRTFRAAELAPSVAYLNSRTRDVEVAWVVQSKDCELFRMDGLQVFGDDKQPLWIPWIAVDWFIPRFELVHLTNGKEYSTDYPKGPTCQEPPQFAVELADSVVVPGQPVSMRRLTIDEDMAALFIYAASPEERDSARVRFISEVEAGKHPRLPRTYARLVHATTVISPPEVVTKKLKLEAVVDVRVHERGGILRVRMVKSSGNAAADREAVRVAGGSAYQPGGEMGVGVPSSVRLHFYFDGGAARVEAEQAIPGFWEN